jgi:3-phenylpropionate/trans-cinnamate dioxygenase ferredoxin reductase component
VQYDARVATSERTRTKPVERRRGSARAGAPLKAPRRIVVVGAGDCGTRAALEVRGSGWDGELVLFGTETAAPYERPPLSKSVLTGSAPMPIAAADALAKAGIEWHPGATAVALDRRGRHVTFADGTKTGFDRLLIATGARARRPAVPGPDVILSLRTAGDAQRLRDRLTPGVRLVVIGGGFIGLEVAASAVNNGCDVTVVEFAHRLMSRVVPAQVAEIVLRRHLDAGARVTCGVGVDRITADGDRATVQLTDGTRITADVVVAGVGALPNTELAASAGLTISNGVSVDATLRTDDPHILAAGDCCSFPHPVYDGTRVRLEAWRNALGHATIAAKNLLGADEAGHAVPWFWSDQYELGVQIAGLHAAAVHEVVRRRDDGIEVRFGIGNDGRVVSASGVAKESSLGRDISIAELLIARGAKPRSSDLADPSVNLRDLARKAP